MKFSQGVSLCLVSLLAFLSSGCVTLKDTFGIRSGEVKVKTDDGYIKVAFSDRDRQTIRDYYSRQRKHKGLPPGLAKRDRLPPGLQKRIDAGQPLPPGLQGRGLPVDLEEILSPLPHGYIRLEVGGDIVIKNQNTEVVVDIMKDIVL